MGIFWDIVDVLGNINSLFYIVGYLMGGIPFGLLLTKIFYGIDVRSVGSGSIGATNVYRAVKEINPKSAKVFAACTILLDATKGTIVVLVAKMFGLSFEAQWLIAILCIIGHCYSPFLGFSGGKGVATTIGSVILLMPIEGLCGLVVWAFVGKVLKISSLSSLLGVFTGLSLTFVIPYVFDLPACIDINAQINSHIPVVLIGLFILYTHIPNIKRLLRGEEKKI